ncbi:MAG: PilZ domain-containing protein [Candidatus Lernaella stagnicola]|nr:PilZ domain-containing protein [Candidatus Lernaella stagnicola]
MENRRQKRVSKNLLAQVTTQTSAFFAYVQDLAKTGLGFSCNRNLSIGEEVEVKLNAPSKPTMVMKGRVAWQRNLPSIAKNKFQYGIGLTEHSDIYDAYVLELLKREYERRTDPRFTDVLTVQADDVLDLLDAAISDVSASGLYVRTGSPLVVGSQYEFKLESEELADPLFVLAEVVAVFDCDLDDLDHPYGAGFKIISFAGKGAEKFADYIKSLEELFKFHWPPEMDAAAK